MHSGLRRLDMALGDENSNTVMVMRHREPAQYVPPSAGGGGHRAPGGTVQGRFDLQARDEMTLFNNGVEGGLKWNPEEFTMLSVQSSVKNAQGQPRSYDLRPVKNAHVVLWYASPAHHEPRSEDGRSERRGSNEVWSGATHVMWTGFDLRPRHWFDTTPLFPSPAR
jgi:hypothetical protein